MMGDETLGVADITEILRLLPHRYPFLLIDRVIDIRGDDHGIGIKNVTINEAHFAGHFPDNRSCKDRFVAASRCMSVPAADAEVIKLPSTSKANVSRMEFSCQFRQVPSLKFRMKRRAPQPRQMSRRGQ
jgi:hypothetical protein